MLSEASIKRIELEIELHLLALQILILLLAAMKACRRRRNQVFIGLLCVCVFAALFFSISMYRNAYKVVVVVVYFDLGVDGDVRSIRWMKLEIELHLLLFVGGDLLQVAGSAQCTPSQLLMAL